MSRTTSDGCGVRPAAPPAPVMARVCSSPVGNGKLLSGSACSGCSRCSRSPDAQVTPWEAADGEAPPLQRRDHFPLCKGTLGIPGTGRCRRRIAVLARRSRDRELGTGGPMTWRVVYSDEIGVRIDRQESWNWQAGRVPEHRRGDPSHPPQPQRRGRDRGAGGQWPGLGVTDLTAPAGARRPLASLPRAPVTRLPICHRRRRCGVHPARREALLLRVVVLVRSTAIRPHARGANAMGGWSMRLMPSWCWRRRSATASVMCKQCAGVRDHLFIFLDHPEVAADNNGSERELRPTGTCRSDWGAGLFAAVRSVISTAARCGIGAYQVIS